MHILQSSHSSIQRHDGGAAPPLTIHGSHSLISGDVTVQYFPKEIAAQGASSAMDDGIHPVLEVLEASVAHLY